MSVTNRLQAAIAVAQIELNDAAGRVRSRLYVGADDAPHLDFLGEAGEVVSTYPPGSH